MESSAAQEKGAPVSTVHKAKTVLTGPISGIHDPDPKRRRWESVPFLAATAAAVFLGDAPSHLSGLVAGVTAIAGCLYAFIPPGTWRVGMLSVLLCLIAGVCLLALWPIGWHWAWLEEPGRVRQAVAVVAVSFAALAVALARELAQLRGKAAGAALPVAPEPLPAPPKPQPEPDTTKQQLADTGNDAPPDSEPACSRWCAFFSGAGAGIVTALLAGAVVALRRR